MNITKKIFIGYKEILVKAISSITTPLKVIAFLLIVFGISIGIVFPLWSLANKNPDGYSLFVLITILSLFLFFVLFKAFFSIKNNGFKYFIFEKILPFLKKTLLFSLLAMSLLFSLNLYSFSILFGLISTVILAIIFGYFKFAYKK